MSTEIGETKDCRNEDYSVEVAYGIGGIKIVFLDKGKAVNQVWLDIQGAKDVINDLMTAIYSSTDGKERYNLNILGG